MNLNSFVSEENFGTDHFTTLAYIETVMVDCGGFQIGLDARMRAGRRNFRVMSQQCPKPRRQQNDSHMAVVMKRENSSILRDGIQVDGHDDWHCVQDMAEAGYFAQTAEEIEPSIVLQLSSRGQDVVSALRVHKASGGTFANFVPPVAAKAA